jgi:multiple sugar transport system permease protein
MHCEPGNTPVFRVTAFVLLLAGAALFVLPFFWMLSTSLKPLNETMSIPPVWLPSHPQWRNYPETVAAMGHFWRYVFNTLWICVMSVIGCVLSSAIVAYGFSRIDWPGRDKVFLLVLASMMMPFAVTIVPLYDLFRMLDWVGTPRPLWVPSFFAPAFNVFLLRQFFLTLPKELNEAARIDGCSEWRIFWQIILPLSKPALTVVALFQFMGSWNDFFGPMIYLTDPKQFTLSVGLQNFQSQQGGTEWHYLMAGAVLVTTPVIILYFLCQKSFKTGIATTGAKN